MAQAREVVENMRICDSWESIGAQVNMVGSLATGLLMDHLDIDFHIYTDRLDAGESFAAAGRIAACRGVERMEFLDKADTEEACYEWHTCYRAADGRVWTIDMIHILRGSAYDGFAERMAQRIREVLDTDARDTILRLKHETPAGVKIAGVQYYAAVLSGGVRDYAQLERWVREHEGCDLTGWLP